MRRFLTTIVLVALAGCASAVEPARPVHYDVGVVHRKVTTDSDEAQLWFDRGLGLAYGFNHKEAIRCFERAAEFDPDCAMAHWGKAYALGPNYNSPAPTPEAEAAAREAILQAIAALDDETAAERTLVAALETRTARSSAVNRRALDEAYAEAMRKARAAHPGDADVAAFAAEAVMQLRPWKLWTPEGEPALELPEIRAILEPALARWPNHPALCHLYIHAMEAGPEAAKALPAARQLETLAPGMGHLVHMPSHIYVWTGRYDDVVRTNLAAVKADEAYVAHGGRENLFTAYRIHNLHFVAYGAMWDGRRELAMEYARRIPAEIPPTLVEQYGDVFEIFLATPYHTMVRFGMWDEIVAEPAPPASRPSVVAVHHYARGVALASLGRVEEVEAEQALFRKAAAAVPASRILFQNPVSEVLKVAEKVLAGEIEYRKENYDRAFALLREAVALDDRLNYDEPWGWMEPARHALGALLTEQGRYEEALEVYRKDLERYPENGWALHGLAECLRELGREAEAATAEARFTAAWSRSDVELRGSCYCRRG